MTAAAHASAWQPQDIVARDDFAGMIKRAAAVRIDHQLLNVKPIRGLGTFGLPDIDISGKFKHMIVVLLDGNGEAVAALHGLAARKDQENEPLEVGAKNSYLRSYPIHANSDGVLRAKARHHYVEGPVFPLIDEVRARAAEQLAIYGKALHDYNVPYAVPFKTIHAEIKKALENVLSQPNTLRNFSHTLCERFLDAPAAFASWIAGEKSGFPVAVHGCNSNSVALDHAAAFGVNLLNIVNDAEAPLCDVSVWKVMEKRLLKSADYAGYDPGLFDWQSGGDILQRPARNTLKPAVVANNLPRQDAA